MSQSLTKLYAHLIFSTKNRKPLLTDSIRPRVHGYLATLIREMGSPYVIVGGVADHVHILFDMGKLHAPVDFVKHVKAESSKFVKTLGNEYGNFYGSSPDSGEGLADFQEEHHRRESFQDELRGFLTRYGIDFDEQYVWD